MENAMRVNGRILRASTLAEWRLLSAFGVTDLRVPRGTNAFVAARRLGRLARYQGPDGGFMGLLLGRQPGPAAPEPSPGLDHTELAEIDHGASRAA
jgi:hypothetical protein